ncbi:alpha/beta hydrolase [Bisgaard Taxon 10/6]|uniref:Alpha/beta hydrolase n=1 Tax=Exercitatus varius TaxID=67857 RepID=A0ABT6EUN6_9PAST|nr:alpha/beta hydrolase [Exercitatus varius]MDG2938976.1 alpha/beta hydrolase [Exercitatus varius]MDG2945827.1 alpha/beta hydrolase [Exercitatus varius]
MKLNTQLKTLTTALFLGSTLFSGAVMAEMTSATAIDVPAQHIQLTQEWDKIFPKSDKVEHRKVTFKNRYGITLAADLYMPKNAQGKLPAITVGGPFGAVKEQVSGLYAQTLAERGFVTLAFDGSFTGESSGLPRNSASPEINTEDFSAAVDFLGSLEKVDREKIGVLGVCGWGGFALNAATADTRIKAVATSTMYDMTRVMAKGYNDSVDADARYKMKQDLNNARWEAQEKDYANTSDTPVLPEVSALNADTPKFVADYVDFYKTKRGYHPRSVGSTGAWTTTTPIAFINMPILQRADELRAPALLVHGEKAHSRYFSEDAFKSLGSKDKELYIVPNATHVDLYDNQANKIPFDKFEQFFKAKLK